MKFLSAVLSVAFACVNQAPADDAPAAPPPPRWLPVATAHMDEVRVFASRDPERVFRRIEQPVFHHVQSTRGRAVGSVFVWTDETQRPVAVGDVFFFESPQSAQLYNEWHSLASEPITVQWNERVLIAPSTAGLVWKPIPDAPTPAATAAQRTRQVRQLAQRFAAHLVNRANDRYELRLLPTPIHRHDDEQADGASGALFAICQETDPEMFLLIESQPGEAGRRWMYAPAEFSNVNHYLRLDDVEVWKAEPPSFSSSGPHTGGHLKDVTLPAEQGADPGVP